MQGYRSGQPRKSQEVTLQRLRLPKSPSQVYLTNEWVSLPDGHSTLVIFDKKISLPKSWIHQFPHKLGVSGGEKLKDVETFPSQIQKILQQLPKASSQKTGLCALGGGSVGDFTGFVASILKRGIPLIYMPSTWLSALDSAHGGKNALNVGGVKNQIGTFYWPQQVYLMRPLLSTQPPVRAQEAMGELIKISLIEGGRRLKQLHRSQELVPHLLWESLPWALRAKYKIVQEDPTEHSGHRRLLNLGHTLGHILESHYKLPHGVAVTFGLAFSAHWSRQKKLISQDTEELALATIDKFFPQRNQTQRRFKPLNQSLFIQLAQKDKKLTSQSSINFVFLHEKSNVIRQDIKLDLFLKEAQRQGWVQ